MKYIKVQGNIEPEAIEILGAKKLANFNIKEVQKEDQDGNLYTIFEYCQLQFNIADDDSYINKVVLENSYKAINDWYEEQVQILTENVPESEKLSWTKQEQEARAYLLDNTVFTPLLNGIVANRGIDKDYLVSKVIEKADLYAQAIGSLTGARQAIEDSLTSV